MDTAYNEVLHSSNESLVVSHRCTETTLADVYRKRISHLTKIFYLTSCNRL